MLKRLKKLRIRKHNKAMLYMLLTFCISILFIALFTIIMIYSQSQKQIVSSLEKVNNSILSQLATELDNQIMDAETARNQLSRSNSIKEAIFNVHMGEELSISDKNTISNEIHAIFPMTGFIDNIYLYFADSDMVISDTSPMSKKIAFNVFHKSSSWDYSDWTALMESISYNKITPLDSPVGPKISVISSLPVNADRADASVVVIFNTEKFVNSINTMNSGSDATFGVYYDKKLLFSNDENDVLAQNLTDILPEDTKGTSYSLIKKLNGKNYVVTVSPSSFSSQMRYISVTPKNEFFRDSRALRLYLIIMLSVMLVIWFGSMYLYIKNNYKPLEQLMKSLQKNLDAENLAEKTELEIIKSGINSAHSEIVNLNSQTRTQSSKLNSYFVKDWLTGRIDDAGAIAHQLAENSSVDTEKPFVVVLFSIKSYEKMYSEFSISDKHEFFDLLYMVITNVANDIFSSHFVFLGSMIDSVTYALVLNPTDAHADEPPAAMLENIRERILMIYNFLYENFAVEFTSGISQPHKTEQVSDAFYEALSVLRSPIHPDSPIAIYREPKNFTFRKFSTTGAHAIEGCIKSGDYERAAQIMEDFFAAANPAQLNSEFLAAVKFNILSIILNALSDEQYNEFLSESLPATTLSACTAFPDVKNAVMTILKDSCNIINNSAPPQNQPNELSQKIIQYIEENYSDPDLNVSTIGYHFNFTSHYLSRQFSTQTGATFKTYINEYRVKKAMELLKNSNLTVSAIAEETGFTSDNALIRVFKKFTGITPLKYRENEKL